MRVNDRAQEDAMSSKLVADARSPVGRGNDAVLARALERARGAILWERLWPALRLAERDPFALRALVLVLVIATFVAAGGEHLRRISAAFDWQGAIAPVNFRIDAWINPPTYTGKPPVILPGLRPGEATQTASNPATPVLSVPVGSTRVIRATGDVHLDVAVTGGLADPKDAPPDPKAAAPSKTPAPGNAPR